MKIGFLVAFPRELFKKFETLNLKSVDVIRLERVKVCVHGLSLLNKRRMNHLHICGRLEFDCGPN